MKQVNEVLEEAAKNGIDSIYTTLADYKIIGSLWDRGAIYKKLGDVIANLLKDTYKIEGKFY